VRAIAEITAVGLDLLLTAFAYGIAQVHVIASPQHRDALAPLRRHAGMIDAIFSGLGFESGRMIIDDGHDPAGLETVLYAAPPPPPVAPAKHAVIGDKRTTLRLALTHLHAAAPRPAETIPLPDGAPFGLVALDFDACTLCLACVGACPTGALGDNPERPHLSFLEINCVQCGLCRATCPERAISLVPRLSFAAAATRKTVLKEEEPFTCARCGKPFGARTTIERMIERLSGHSMFAAPGRLDLLKLCEDCRVAAQFEAEAPMASRPRQPPRTADDYRRQTGGANDDPE
jgi:ferredoxin